MLGSRPPITNNRGNLGQTSCEYPINRQNLGWWEKSKIPDRLGFSRHMKTIITPLHTAGAREI